MRLIIDLIHFCAILVTDKTNKGDTDMLTEISWIINTETLIGTKRLAVELHATMDKYLSETWKSHYYITDIRGNDITTKLLQKYPEKRVIFQTALFNSRNQLCKEIN